MKKKTILLIFIFLLNLGINGFAQKIFVKTLPNGLKISNYRFNSRISAISVIIRAGSIYDFKNKYGLANFVSKMLKRGGTEKYSSDRILNLLDKYGIELFSSCSKDFITVGMKFINDYKSEALDIFSQILFHPAFNMKEFDSLKKEILGEIQSLKNNNDYLAVHQGFVKILKNPDFSHTSLGTEKDVRNITINDLKKFYKQYFVPKNMVVSFCGDFTNKEIENFVNKNFNFKGRNIDFKSENKPLEFSGISGEFFHNKNLKQSYIYILFPSEGYLSKDFYTIKVLSFILGGNLTSILPEKIRKEKGLAYSVFSTNYPMMEGGVFVIGMQTENKNRKDAINTIKRVLENLKQNGISSKLISTAKKYFEGSLYIGLQSTYALASNIASGILLNKSLPPWDYDLKMIKKVNSKEVNKVMKKIFNFNKMVISVVGKK